MRKKICCSMSAGIKCPKRETGHLFTWKRRHWWSFREEWICRFCGKEFVEWGIGIDGENESV